MSDNGRLSPARWEESLHCQMGGCSALCNHIVLFHLPIALQLHCNCIATALQLHYNCIARTLHTRKLIWCLADARCVWRWGPEFTNIHCAEHQLPRQWSGQMISQISPQSLYASLHTQTLPMHNHTPYHHKHNCAGTIANSVQLELWLCPLLCPTLTSQYVLQ